MDADFREAAGVPLLAAFAKSGIYREHSIHIGDRFSVGSAEVLMTEPRLPSYKPRGKSQMDDMVKPFLARRGDISSVPDLASTTTLEGASLCLLLLEIQGGVFEY